jgi:CBS domain-containing protein
MNMSIRDVMTTDTVTVGSTASLDSVAQLMRDNDVGCVPVVDEGELQGLVTDRDIVVRCLALGRQPAATPAGDVSSSEVQTVTPEDSLHTAAGIMRDHALRRLPVVDGRKLVGMVTIGDLAGAVDQDSPLADISQAPPNT